MSEYQLYCLAQSGHCYRAALMLNLIGADWEPLSIDFFGKAVQRPAEYRADINEMGEIPVLVHGNNKFSQSGVILTYLAERTGCFLPRGDDARLEILRWLLFDNQKVNGFLGPFRLLRKFARPPGPAAVLEFFKGRIDNTLAILDRRLATPRLRTWPRTDYRRSLVSGLYVLPRGGIWVRYRGQLSLY
jgi:glutathione S-transferase